MNEKQAEDFIANAVIILAIIGLFTVVCSVVMGLYFLGSWLINLL